MNFRNFIPIFCVLLHLTFLAGCNDDSPTDSSPAPTTSGTSNESTTNPQSEQPSAAESATSPQSGQSQTGHQTILNVVSPDDSSVNTGEQPAESTVVTNFDSNEDGVATNSNNNYNWRQIERNGATRERLSHRLINLCKEGGQDIFYRSFSSDIFSSDIEASIVTAKLDYGKHTVDLGEDGRVEIFLPEDCSTSIGGIIRFVHVHTEDNNGIEGDIYVVNSSKNEEFEEVCKSSEPSLEDYTSIAKIEAIFIGRKAVIFSLQGTVLFKDRYHNTYLRVTDRCHLVTDDSLVDTKISSRKWW